MARSYPILQSELLYKRTSEKENLSDGQKRKCAEKMCTLTCEPTYFPLKWAPTWAASKNKTYFAGSEVLTAVVMKSSIFWDITPHNLLKVN
jgi:hypothetical protein